MDKYNTLEEAKVALIEKGYSPDQANELAPDFVNVKAPPKIEVKPKDDSESLAKEMQDTLKKSVSTIESLTDKIAKLETAQVKALECEQEAQKEVKRTKQFEFNVGESAQDAPPDTRAAVKDIMTKAFELRLRSVAYGLKNHIDAIKGYGGGVGGIAPVPYHLLPEMKEWFGIESKEQFDAICQSMPFINTKVGDIDYQQRALRPGSTSAGAEFIETTFSTQLVEKFRVESPFLSEITTIPVLSSTFKLPKALTDIQFRYGGKGAGTAADRGAGYSGAVIRPSDRATGNITFTPGKFEAAVEFDDDMVEDSIIPMVAFLQSSIIKAGTEQLPRAILMGDTITAATGNVNTDDAAPESDAYYLIFDGIIRKCLDAGALWYYAPGATLTLAHFDTLASRLGKFILNPAEARVAMNADTIVRVRNLLGAQATTNYMNAEVRAGVLMSIAGMSVVPTSGIMKTEADGKMSATTANNTKLNAMAYNKVGILLGVRKDFTMEMFRYPNQSNALTMVMRCDLQYSWLTDTDDGVQFAYMYNAT